jgi:hypothetical protein
MTVQYRSGNIALTVVIITVIAFIIKNSLEGKPTDEFNTILIIAIASRALSGVLLIKNYHVAGIRITSAVGSFWILFVIASHGISIHALPEAIPGIAFILFALLGKYKPMITAIIFGFLSLLAFGFISFFVRGGFTFYQFITGLLVSLPLAAASFCFYRGSQTIQGNA